MSSPTDSRSHLQLVPPDGGRRVLRTEGSVGGLQYEAGLGFAELTLPNGPDATPAAPAAPGDAQASASSVSAAHAALPAVPSPAPDRRTDGRDPR